MIKIFVSLQKYICQYCCKGAQSTEELKVVYSELLDNADESATVKNIVHKLLMKLVGMIDIPASAADYLNTGGQLYHSTRIVRKIGLSGYRLLNMKGNDDKLTKQTSLDQFLSKKRRAVDPNISLWD